MNVDAKPEPPDPAVQRENARTGYEAAVALMIAEGNLIWTRYGLMLLVQTIILTAIGLTSDTPAPVRAVILFGLTLVGLVLCTVWWLMNDIGFRYFFYWWLAARELEERYLAPAQTLGRDAPPPGDDLIGMARRKHEMLPMGTKDPRRVVLTSKAIIAIFALLYTVFLVVFTLSLARPGMLT